MPDPEIGVNCWPEPEVAQNINNTELGALGLSDEEEDAIVAFLATLTDGFFDPPQRGRGPRSKRH